MSPSTCLPPCSPRPDEQREIEHSVRRSRCSFRCGPILGEARAMEPSEETSGDPTSWEALLLVGLVSSLVVLAALLVIAAVEWRSWHIGLLVWGLGVAAAAVLYPFVTEKWALRRIPGAADAAKTRLHKRQRLSGVNMGIIAVGVAVVASGTGWTAVDAAFTALFLVIGGGSFLAGVYVVRRQMGPGGD